MEGALCLVIAVLLSAGVVNIYRDGMAVRESTDALAWIYTKEKIGAAFLPAAIWLWLAIVLAVPGLIMGTPEWKIGKPVDPKGFQKELLRRRVQSPSPEMQREQKLQTIYAAAGTVLFAACMIPILLYLTDLSHFPGDQLETMFYGLISVLLPWTFLGLICLFLFSLLKERSEAREIEEAKARLREEKQTNGSDLKSAAVSANETAFQKERRLMMIRLIAAAAAVIMIIAGICNGGLKDVLVKAINLCTECVGLG